MKATRRLHRRAIRLSVDGREIDGDLVLPETARALVLFAHGTGSGRQSPRNRFVANALHEAALGTLLIDLLTTEEETYDDRTLEVRFDIELLAGRLVLATGWLEHEPSTKHLPFGYFGASTGAAAAIVAATQRPEARAIVSRGGRPDLAGPALSAVRSPTLLIVGGNDPEVLELNQQALEILEVPKKLEVVPGATHLFEEPGAIDQVARLATEWFAEFL